MTLVNKHYFSALLAHLLLFHIQVYTIIADTTLNKVLSQTTARTKPETITNCTNGSDNRGRCCTDTSITLSSSLHSISVSAFQGCALTSLTLPSTIQYIGQMAFAPACAIEFDDQPKCEKQSALGGALTIPDSVTYIDSYAFSEVAITSLSLGSGLIYIGKSAFVETRSLAGSLIIPDSVTVIDNSAFYGSSISTLYIGSGIARIGTGAFYSSSLTKIIINSNAIKELPVNAFDCNPSVSIFFTSTASDAYNAFQNALVQASCTVTLLTSSTDSQAFNPPIPAVPRISSCPQGYMEFAKVNKCYMVQTTRISWYAANTLCSTKHKRAHLLSIGSRDEEVFVRNHILRDHNITIWMGLNRLDNPSSTTSYQWYLKGAKAVLDTGYRSHSLDLTVPKDAHVSNDDYHCIAWQFHDKRRGHWKLRSCSNQPYRKTFVEGFVCQIDAF